MSTFQGELIPSMPSFISCTKVQKLLKKKNCVAWVVAVSEEVPSEVEISKISVVNEFLDVFPEELPELPPEREIEFMVDLIPGTEPISIPPYRMTPAELKELKK